MKYVLALSVALVAATAAHGDELVRREQTVTGRMFVQDRLGARFVDCTPALYKRLEHGRWRYYRRAVDCPDPTGAGLNTTHFLVPAGPPRYRDAQFSGYNKKGWIVLK